MDGARQRDRCRSRPREIGSERGPRSSEHARRPRLEFRLIPSEVHAVRKRVVRAGRVLPVLRKPRISRGWPRERPDTATGGAAHIGTLCGSGGGHHPGAFRGASADSSRAASAAVGRCRGPGHDGTRRRAPACRRARALVGAIGRPTTPALSALGMDRGRCRPGARGRLRVREPAAHGRAPTARAIRETANG